MEIATIEEFEAVDGREAQLEALLVQHARRTREQEPGCLRLETLRALDGDTTAAAGRLVLLGLWAGRAALDAYRQGPRRTRLEAALAPLLAARRSLSAQALAPRPAAEGIRPEDLDATNDD